MKTILNFYKGNFHAGISILCFAIVLLISACSQKKEEAVSGAAEENHSSETIHLSEGQAKAIGLVTDTVAYRNLTTSLKVNGKLTLPPQNRATVSVLMGGIVKDIFVREGELVSKGQTLALLENLDFLQLQQDFLETQSRVKYLEAEVNRQTSLQEDRINSSKTLQQAQSEYEASRAKQEALSEKLRLFGTDVSVLSVTTMKASFPVKAPIGGYIKMINVTMGQFTEPNRQLFDVVDNRFLHIDLMVFEQDVAKVKAGQQVSFSIVNDPHHPHTATIFSINKAFEDNQQAVIAHAKINESDDELLPGMFIEARIDMDDDKVLSLPDEAIVSNGDDHFIYIQETEDVFRQVPVKTGATDMGFTEIIPLETIPPHNPIVVKGAYYLFSELTKGEGEHQH